MSFFSIFSRPREQHAMPTQSSAVPERTPPGNGFADFPKRVVGQALTNIRARIGQPSSSAAEMQARDRQAAEQRHAAQFRPVSAELRGRAADTEGHVGGPAMAIAGTSSIGRPAHFGGVASPQRGAPSGPRFGGLRDMAGGR